MGDVDPGAIADGGALGTDPPDGGHRSLLHATRAVASDFRRRLDELISVVERDEQQRGGRTPPDSLSAAGRRLSSQQRREIQSAIDSEFDRLRSELETRLGPDGPPAPPEKRLPMSTDLAALTVEHVLGDVDPVARMAEVVAGLTDRFPVGNEYIAGYAAWRARAGSPSAVVSAAYQGAVSEFESVLAALLRLVASIEPSSLGLNGFDEAAHRVDPERHIRDLIWSYTDQVTDQMRGGSKQWLATISSVFGVDPATMVAEPDALAEVYERRHVLVHRGGVADSKYVRATGREEAIGSRLDPDGGTFIAAVGLLDALGTQLAACWLHAVRPEWPVDATLAWSALLRQLELEQWSTARAIALGVCQSIEWQGERDAFQVNTWMAQLHAGVDDRDAIRRTVEEWTVPAGSDLAIARACLLEDEDEAVLALQRFVSNGGNPRIVAAWPLGKRMAKRSRRFGVVLRGRPRRPRSR